MRIVLALLLLAASLLRHGTGGAKYLSAQQAKSEEKERRELYGAEKEARRIIAGRTFDSLPEQALEYNLLKEGLGKAEAASVARYVESLPDRAREANPADIAGTKELEDIVYCPGFANLPNAIEFAKAYVLSTRRYRIAGVRNNGTVDCSDVP